MFQRSLLRWACLLSITLSATMASAEDLGKYRDFSLGSSVQSVMGLTRAQASDLKTVHERPVALRELTWRPRYSAGRALPDVDPVREMVFDFYDDQLYRITVYYERSRTAGLTHEDLILALTGEYGSPLPASARGERPRGIAPSDAATPIAEWESGDTRVYLYWSDYHAGFGLQVTSEPLQALARSASVAAAVLDAREAPAREVARQKKADDDLKAAQALIRETNKGAFRP